MSFQKTNKNVAPPTVLDRKGSPTPRPTSTTSQLPGDGARKPSDQKP